jgi:hypothetical protein
MVYNCFLDDSKDQTQEQMIISAGFFAPDKRLLSVLWPLMQRLTPVGNG